MVRLAHLCNLLQKGSSLIPSSSHRRILLAVDGNLTHVGLSLMVHNCKYRLLRFFFFLPRKFPQNFISKYVLNYEPRIERSFSEATVCSRIGCSESTQLRRRRGLKLPFRTGSCISQHFVAACAACLSETNIALVLVDRTKADLEEDLSEALEGEVMAHHLHSCQLEEVNIIGSQTKFRPISRRCQEMLLRFRLR